MNIKRLTFSVAIYALCGCSMFYDKILERKDVAGLEVKEVNSDSKLLLKISGLAVHSALAVHRIESELDGTSVIVLVHLTPAQSGMSGSFAYQLSVPDFVDKVRFGAMKTVIWERTSGQRESR